MENFGCWWASSREVKVLWSRSSSLPFTEDGEDVKIITMKTDINKVWGHSISWDTCIKMNFCVLKGESVSLGSSVVAFSVCFGVWKPVPESEEFLVKRSLVAFLVRCTVEPFRSSGVGGVPVSEEISNFNCIVHSFKSFSCSSEIKEPGSIEVTTMTFNSEVWNDNCSEIVTESWWGLLKG